MISAIKTVKQQIIDTGNSPKPTHEETIPANSASNPITVEPVIFKIAGKVITDKVTYGT